MTEQVTGSPQSLFASLAAAVFQYKENMVHVLVYAGIIPVFRLLLEFAILKPFSRALLIPTTYRKAGTTPDKLQNKVIKLSEALWKLIAYSSFVALELAVSVREAWFWDTKELWAGWPNQPISPGLDALYHIQIGFYVCSVVMLLGWEVKRKDDHMMLLHHFITMLLVGFSYHNRYTRVGCLLMLLHDINDVFMEAAKSFNYCRSEPMATILFAMFVLSWFVLRVLCFPLVIMRSTLFEVQDVLGYTPVNYHLFNALLTLLYCIHLYWTVLISRIVWTKVVTGQAEDVREEDED